MLRIMCLTIGSRDNPLTVGISMQNISFTFFFFTNPYSSRNHDPSVNTLKVRLCGLPLSVVELLNKLEAKLKSKILYEKIRYPVTSKMTSVLIGNRFMYIEPLENGKVLPRVSHYASIRCMFFNYGQPKTHKTQITFY